jgi:S1-C subfamily serine protease
MDTPEYPTWPPATGPDGAAVPAAPRGRRSGRSRAVAAAALAAGLGLGAGGGVLVHSAATTQSAASTPQWSVGSGSGSSATGWYPGRRRFGSGTGTFGGGTGAFGGGADALGGGTSQAATAATSAQQTGVVDIDVVLGGTARAAGTGMVLTSDGEVLTNRHVVEGETSISVTVAATGRIYSARVVGVSTTTDVAVVQLANASGLATVQTSAAAVRMGDSVVGVGNAGGTGGTPSAAAGSVTGVDRSITASDTDGSNPEQLTGLIETDAGIRPGDSGGPLLNASDQAVGMDTAASAQGNDGYAIPIATALTVARQIEAGGAGTRAGAGTAASTSSHGYLGVEVVDGADGAEVAGVAQGSPAARAGMTPGDTITSVAGHQVGSVADLSAVMSSLPVGRHVSVSWVDQDGVTHTARVTLTAGQ